MAVCPVSWCKETDEKINYTKLCRLLVDGGSQAVRGVFDGIHPPSSLTAVLNTNKTALQKRKKPIGKVLNNEQWDKLYPPSGSNPKSEDFDITLLFVLLRNICPLTPPVYEISSSGKRKRSWDELPHKTENSNEANLVRIKYYRNNIVAHKPNTEVNDVDFEQCWQDISSALLSLGLSQEDIDDLKSARLGKKDYNTLLYDWFISDKDIKTQLDDMKSSVADVKSDTTVIKSDTRDIKSDTTHIKSDTTDIKSDTTDIKSDMKFVKSTIVDMSRKDTHNLIGKLSFSDFKREITLKCNSFHPNTRRCILDQVKSYVDSIQPESCVMLITAGPGMGKSTIAAKICQMHKELGSLGACHFFQFSNSTRNNPSMMLQSIARQMCDTVPGYGEALERRLQSDPGKKIAKMNCEELLTVLLEEPLCHLEQTNSKFVVVIDALDECLYDPKDEPMRALRKKLQCLPSWLRFIITSRPSTNTSLLQATVAVEIKTDDQSNLQDLECYFCWQLTSLYPQYDKHGMEKLVKICLHMTKGLFLMAFFVIDLLKNPNPEKVVEELFPNGISSVYENYFSRLKKVLLPYILEEERFYKMLHAVVATKNPLPKNMFYNILGLKSERDVLRTEIQVRKDAMNLLHSLFPVENDHIGVFHKSLIDFLIIEEGENDSARGIQNGTKTSIKKLSCASESVATDTQNNETSFTSKNHEFSVRVKEGEKLLADQCHDVLSDIRNGGKDLHKPLDLTDSEKYALRFVWDLTLNSNATTIIFNYYLNGIVTTPTTESDTLYHTFYAI